MLRQSFVSTPGPIEAKQWQSFEKPHLRLIKGHGRVPLLGHAEIARGEYPFSMFVGNRASLLQLEHLLGAGCVHGGCLLVTGCRGAGKTTLVNRAIYEAGLLGRYDLKDAKEPDSFIELNEQLRVSDSIQFVGKKQPPTLVVELRINASSQITTDALLRRLVRSFYWSLVGAGIAGLVPDLIESARLACIRTVGGINVSFEEWIKDIERQNTNVKVTSKDGLEVQLGAAAHSEFQIARKMAVHLGISKKEEMEEELLRLFEGLQGVTLGGSPSIWQRVGRVASWAKGMWEAIKESVQGGTGLRVSLVVVFDELDKLDLTDSRSQAKSDDQQDRDRGNNIQDDLTNEPKSPHYSASLEPEAHSLITRTHEKLIRSSDDLLQNTDAIACALKPLLTSGQATFVFVGGTRLAQCWRDDRGNRDAILPSVFTDHVHVRCFRSSDIRDFLRINVREQEWKELEGTAPEDADTIVFGLLFRSAGILKELLLELRSLVTRHHLTPGPIPVQLLQEHCGDATYKKGAFIAFAIEHALTKYTDQRYKVPISERGPFKQDPSLFEDLKSCFFDLAHGIMEEGEMQVALESLVPKSKSEERLLLDEITSVVPGFPDKQPTGGDERRLFNALREEWLNRWPPLTQDDSVVSNNIDE